jgi:hypothetical protein
LYDRTAELDRPAQRAQTKSSALSRDATELEARQIARAYAQRRAALAVFVNNGELAIAAALAGHGLPRVMS